ncbi:MAG: hypothetical protein M3Y59_19170 [Myxococcota bacterium]|nr:hypothetical protein [Myxococcota bacterium]
MSIKSVQTAVREAMKVAKSEATSRPAPAAPASVQVRGQADEFSRTDKVEGFFVKHNLPVSLGPVQTMAIPETGTDAGPSTRAYPENGGDAGTPGKDTGAANETGGVATRAYPENGGDVTQPGNGGLVTRALPDAGDPTGNCWLPRDSSGVFRTMAIPENGSDSGR